MIRHDHTRRGLTLVEILVVLAIMTLLVALVMAGVSAVRDRQMVNSTSDTVRKLQQAIDTQVQSLVDQAAADARNRTTDFQSLLSYCGNDTDRAQALLTYLRIRHAFPQSYTEATSNVILTLGAQTYINWPPHKAYSSLPVAISTWSPEEQSAALLYLGLSKMGTGGAAFASDDGTAGNQDANWRESGVTVYTDSWKRPICFARLHENAMLNASPYANPKPNAPSLDPFDPLGKLGGTASNSWGNKGAAQTQLGVAFSINNKVITPYSWGADKKSNGLDPNSDDIVGYKLRQLGSNSPGRKQ